MPIIPAQAEEVQDTTPLHVTLPDVLRSYARANRLAVGPTKRNMLQLAAGLIERQSCEIAALRKEIDEHLPPSH